MLEDLRKTSAEAREKRKGRRRRWMRLHFLGATVEDADAAAWAEAVEDAGGTVSDAQRVRVTTLIATLKSASVWTPLDRLWLFAAENATQALTDLKARATATATNSPTFTANRGYAGNGTTSFVNSNFNPSTASGNYTRNDAMFGCWVETAQTASAAAHTYVGAYVTNYAYMSQNNTTQNKWAANANGNTLFTFSTQTGLWVPQRTGANAQALFKDGASVATDTRASTVLENRTVVFLALDISAFEATDARLALGVIGKSLTAAQHAGFYAAARAYMTAVGVA